MPGSTCSRSTLSGLLWAFGAGGQKYEDRNWEKGYNWSLSFAAMQRHLALWWNGEDESHSRG